MAAGTVLGHVARAAACVLLLASACAAHLVEPAPYADTRPAVRLDRARLVEPWALSEEMRAWALDHVPREGQDGERLTLLFDALRDPHGLGLEYDPGNTATAREVFESRRFNCLSFSHLLVGMARAVDIPAYYVRVPVSERYEKAGDLVVVSGHVTVGYGSGPGRLVLKYNTGRSPNWLLSVRISDATASAMYYAGRGVELLRARQHHRAREWLELAVEADAGLVGAWVNLGVARRRAGDPEAAEQAYRKAIELDPWSLAAYHNLASLLRRQGDRDAARELLHLLDRQDNKNPHIYLGLGDASLEEGRVEEAGRFYLRALELAREDAETRAAMGLVALASGEPERARRWLERALELDATDPRASALARTLEQSRDNP